jgi:FkbM family methyltransferase
LCLCWDSCLINMDIFFNTDPRFTKWVVDLGLLREDFVVVDVGVLGGESPRWQFLGDHLVVHGFDAIREVIDELVEKEKTSSKKTYHWFAIADEDGEREFFFVPSNPTSSSFGTPGQSRFADGTPTFQSRRVPVRSLDSLLGSGVIQPPDFLKVDVEGYEKYVFLGAAKCISLNLLGIEAETSFNTSSIYPDTQIGDLQDAVLKHGFLLFDLNFNRVARATYQAGRQSLELPALTNDEIGRPATFNVLYCRDLIAEAAGTQFYNPVRTPLTVDQILKAMIVYELHGLNDVAFDTSIAFAEVLGARLDVEKAGRLLLVGSGRASTHAPQPPEKSRFLRRPWFLPHRERTKDAAR